MTLQIPGAPADGWIGRQLDMQEYPEVESAGGLGSIGSAELARAFARGAQ
jgi:hypothetical protein